MEILTVRTTWRFAAPLVLALCGCREAPPPAQGAAQPAGTAPHASPAAARLWMDAGSFAFADTAGRELLALDTISVPGHIRAALCPRGAVLPVRFARRQSARSGGDGRQDAAGFGDQAGVVFEVDGPAAPPDGTCYLTADPSLAASVEAPAPRRTTEPCDTTLRRRAAEARGRAVTACWPLAAGRSGAQVYAVQFATAGTHALAGLLLADSARLLIADFPADYRGKGYDVWRVDDGGRFSPEGFAILFLGRLRGTPVMGVTWMGTEGENAFLLAGDSAGALRFVTKSYRYLAAE